MRAVLKGTSKLSCIDGKFKWQLNITNFYFWIVLNWGIYAIISEERKLVLQIVEGT